MGHVPPPAPGQPTPSAVEAIASAASDPTAFGSAPGLGEGFEPLLREACGGRLGPIAWFRTDWQRGGAKTGRAAYRTDGGQDVAVVVKVPVGPSELLWNRRMQPGDDDPHGVTARLFAWGTTLGSYDLAWMVMERFSEGPLFNLKRPDAIALMADAACRFYRRASQFPVEGSPRVEDWVELLRRAHENCHTHRIANEQRWSKALKAANKPMKATAEEWAARPCRGWCHGDLHPANAMSRSNRPEDPAMLIDLAEVRPGHWVEDAVYLERLFWTRREMIKEHPPVKMIARLRREMGLSDEENVARLADIRRFLLAATTPAFLKAEGNPAFLEACLNVLEETAGRLK